MGAGLGRQPHQERRRIPPRLVHLAPAGLGRADSRVLRRPWQPHPRRPDSAQRRRSDRAARLQCLVREIRPPNCGRSANPAIGTGPEAAAKSNDTLDVWIDSGFLLARGVDAPPNCHSDIARTLVTTHTHNCLSQWQADVYLEGSDQHRGWFQSSLLLSLAGNGAAPIKTVLTHGFMVDADREKISKSKQGQGGYEKPQTAEAYVKKYGADVVRLWVASQDFRNDLVVSEERINKVGETYRIIRNTLRYQLSNLYDFDPAIHAVPDDRLTGLDRWILAEFSRLEQDVIAAYDLRISRRVPADQPVRRGRTFGDLSRRGQGPALH